MHFLLSIYVLTKREISRNDFARILLSFIAPKAEEYGISIYICWIKIKRSLMNCIHSVRRVQWYSSN